MRAAAILLALPFLLAPVLAQGPAPVAVVDFAFAPGLVTVNPGDVVVWQNQGSVTHTVTADDGSWSSGLLPPGATYSQAFRAPGVVAYHCAIHLSMRGRVIVRDPTLPDLVVSSLAVEDGALPTQKVVRWEVANEGGAAAGASVLRLSFSDARGEHPLSDVPVGALASGERQQGAFAWDGTGDVGTFTLHASADALQAVAEGPAEANDDASAGASFGADLGTGLAALPLAPADP